MTDSKETMLLNYLSTQLKRKNYTSYVSDSGVSCKRVPILESEVEACSAIIDSKRGTGEYLEVGKDFASFAKTSESGKTSYINLRPREKAVASSIFGDAEEPSI